MTFMRAAFLCFMMLSAIVVSGVGIYAAGVTADYAAVDGYGVTAAADHH
jgi:hypothetical protein